jgi:hypothetical protein
MMNLSEQKGTHKKIIAQAMKDKVFRQQLLSSPVAVLERELGISLPEGVNIQVHEETSTTLHLVLPRNPLLPKNQHLAVTSDTASDVELEQAATGRPENTSDTVYDCFTNYCATNDCTQGCITNDGSSGC